MKNSEPRLSHPSLQILRMFLDQPLESLSGSDISKKTGILSGTLYPILLRFERVGWLKSQWELLNPKEEGRPRRRLYKITGLGQNKAKEALLSLGSYEGRPAWNT